MEKFFLTLIHSWGSDTPSEVFWALNDLIKWAKEKGFTSSYQFDNPLDYEGQEENQVIENNEKLISELSNFFDNLKL